MNKIKHTFTFTIEQFNRYNEILSYLAEDLTSIYNSDPVEAVKDFLYEKLITTN